MKWAFESKDFYMVYILYTEYGVGIPNIFLYNLECKKTFKSIQDFLDNGDTLHIQNKYLQKICVSFQTDQYTQLKEWDGKFGYRFKP